MSELAASGLRVLEMLQFSNPAKLFSYQFSLNTSPFVPSYNRQWSLPSHQLVYFALFFYLTRNIICCVLWYRTVLVLYLLMEQDRRNKEGFDFTGYIANATPSTRYEYISVNLKCLFSMSDNTAPADGSGGFAIYFLVSSGRQNTLFGIFF